MRKRRPAKGGQVAEALTVSQPRQGKDSDQDGAGCPRQPEPPASSLPGHQRQGQESNKNQPGVQFHQEEKPARPAKASAGAVRRAPCSAPSTAIASPRPATAAKSAARHRPRLGDQGPRQGAGGQQAQVPVRRVPAQSADQEGGEQPRDGEHVADGNKRSGPVKRLYIAGETVRPIGEIDRRAHWVWRMKATANPACQEGSGPGTIRCQAGQLSSVTATAITAAPDQSRACNSRAPRGRAMVSRPYCPGRPSSWSKSGACPTLSLASTIRASRPGTPGAMVAEDASPKPR